MNTAETRISLLTPPGRGALATISVRGPQAWQMTNACLTRPIELTPEAMMRPWLREFRSSLETSEELVVSFPHPQEARIHCHGGLAACEAVLIALERQGAVRWQHDIFARRALAGALTERTALTMLDQLQGAWERETQELNERHIKTLLARVPLGMHLTEPWQVVLAGRPNAGKSSLLNALLGFQRSITSPQPGTTRDVVTARTAFDGWPVELRDTAGLRRSSDALEIAGVARAEEELRTADLVLYLIPADESAAEAARQLEEVRKLVPQGRLLEVRTKTDLSPAFCRENTIGVSTVTGEGLPELAAQIVQQLIGSPPPPGAAVPICAEQRTFLEQALSSLQNGSSCSGGSLGGPS